MKEEGIEKPEVSFTNENLWNDSLIVGCGCRFGVRQASVSGFHKDTHPK